MECDVCGKKEASFIIQVEGAKMAACRGCAYHGKILFSLEEDAPRKEFRAQEGRGVPKSMQLEEDLVEDYGKIVRKERESRGLKIEEFARQINEKASYLDKIENQSTRPPIETAKKLEKALGVKILEKIKESSVPSDLTKYKKKELSLLDMLEMQQKKGK
ncbi:TIGR00270 family protein [Candidatus Micrarchaeota archaeon]|nr:TIGR00270 family protein [Candidatus Micrarchaeota archaeon]MBD3417684.1 TIGR00270 family protein [Candidatus Micrarchaeota archaeon]